MPFVNLSWDVKTTKEKKRELMNFITDTIADLTSTDKNRIYVFIRDYDEENVGSPSCPVVQIHWVRPAGKNTRGKSRNYETSAGKNCAISQCKCGAYTCAFLRCTAA